MKPHNSTLLFLIQHQLEIISYVLILINLLEKISNRDHDFHQEFRNLADFNARIKLVRRRQGSLLSLIRRMVFSLRKRIELTQKGETDPTTIHLW